VTSEAGRAGARGASQRALAKLVLSARRRGVRPPAIVKRVLRRVVASDVESIQLEGWTAPLVGDGPLGVPPIDPATLELGYETHPHIGDGSATLRCLVAVGDCDVAGSAQVAAFLTRRLGEHGIATALAYTPDLSLPDAGSARLADQLRTEGWSVDEVRDAPAAAAVLDGGRFDVISAHGAPDWWVDLASERSIPMLDTLHLPGGVMFEDWPAESARGRRLAGIIAVSDLLRREYLSHDPGIDPRTVTVIPNSIDERRLPRADRARARAWLGLTDEFLFVSLGRFTTQKNPFGLIAAFDRVAAEHPQAHLLIAGRLMDRGYVAQVLALRDSLACRERVHLRDHSAWPSALLAAADAYVLDSFFEGFALSSMEALYAGVPVVLTEVGGAREQIDDGRAGYLVPNPLGDPLAISWDAVGRHAYHGQRNHDELVAAMRRMIGERERWAARREELSASAAERFHADRALTLHADAVRHASAGAETKLV
jgi:glycosyltransferase involved in cell wall biosynthesis